MNCFQVNVSGSPGGQQGGPGPPEGRDDGGGEADGREARPHLHRDLGQGPAAERGPGFSRSGLFHHLMSHLFNLKMPTVQYFRSVMQFLGEA